MFGIVVFHGLPCAFILLRPLCLGVVCYAFCKVCGKSAFARVQRAHIKGWGQRGGHDHPFQRYAAEQHRHGHGRRQYGYCQQRRPVAALPEERDVENADEHEERTAGVGCGYDRRTHQLPVFGLGQAVGLQSQPRAERGQGCEYEIMYVGKREGHAAPAGEQRARGQLEVSPPHGEHRGERAHDDRQGRLRPLAHVFVYGLRGHADDSGHALAEHYDYQQAVALCYVVRVSRRATLALGDVRHGQLHHGGHDEHRRLRRAP